MKRILALATMALFAFQAAAEFEIRAHYGPMTGKPDSFNTGIEDVVVGNPDVKAMTPMGADVIYALPIIGLAVGLRHEIMNQKVKGNGTISAVPVEAENIFETSRTSVLVGWRLIETPLFYVGALAHYAIAKDAKYNLKLSGADNKYDVSVDNSYGVGVDGAVTLGMFLVGGEVGYTMFKLKDFKDKDDGGYLQNGSGKRLEADFSGTYVKVHIGISI